VVLLLVAAVCVCIRDDDDFWKEEMDDSKPYFMGPKSIVQKNKEQWLLSTGKFMANECIVAPAQLEDS